MEGRWSRWSPEGGKEGTQRDASREGMDSGEGSAPRPARQKPRGKYAGHVGVGQAGHGAGFRGPETMEEGPWLQRQGLEGGGRGKRGQARPRGQPAGPRPALWAPLLTQFPQVPRETLRYHCHVGNANPESGTQGKLRHSKGGGAPPSKRHLIRGDLHETSKLSAAAAAAEGGDTPVLAPGQLL